MDYYNYTEELLKKLVSIPTDKQNETDAMPVLAEALSSHGFSIEYQDTGNNRSNLIASYGQSDNKLILCGHLDVVPAGNSRNEGELFKPTCKNGKIYGRGTADMKGAIAAMTASAILAAENKKLENMQLILLFVADEEVNSTGAEYFASHFKATDKTDVIIGEPTELSVCVAHRGIMQFKITVNGVQCHSSTPEKGINSIYESIRFIEEIKLIDKEFKKMECGILPAPNISVTMFDSGTVANIIPGTALLTVDCRTVPEITDKTLLNDLNSVLERLYKETEVTYSIEPLKYKSAASLVEDNNAFALLNSVNLKLNDSSVKPECFNACCDLYCFGENGFKSAVVCGPGSLKQAHTADEFIEIGQLHKAVDLYYEIIKQKAVNK